MQNGSRYNQEKDLSANTGEKKSNKLFSPLTASVAAVSDKGIKAPRQVDFKKSLRENVMV